MEDVEEAGDLQPATKQATLANLAPDYGARPAAPAHLKYFVLHDPLDHFNDAQH